MQAGRRERLDAIPAARAGSRRLLQTL